MYFKHVCSYCIAVKFDWNPLRSKTTILINWFTGQDAQSQEAHPKMSLKAFYRNKISACSADVQNRGCFCLNRSQIQFNSTEKIKAASQMCPPSLYFTSLHLLSFFLLFFSWNSLIQTLPPLQPNKWVSVTSFSANGSLSAVRQPANCTIMCRCACVCMCVCVRCSPTEAFEGQFSDGFSSCKVLSGPISGTMFCF